MKIPMMQSITAMNAKPNFKAIKQPANYEAIKDKAVKARKHCLALIKEGEINLNVLANALDVHRNTLIGYLKELRYSGYIEFTTYRGAKIVNVL